MDHNDQRDFAEEAANAAEIAREGNSELADEALDATSTYRHGWKLTENSRATLASKYGKPLGGSERKSFTAMAPEGICEVLWRMEASNESYDMSLAYGDFWNFLIALRHLHNTPETAEDLKEWAAQMISDIAETFNVEMI